MGYEHGPDAQNHIVANSDQMRVRRLENAVVANPDAPPKLDTPPSMKPHP